MAQLTYSEAAMRAMSDAMAQDKRIVVLGEDVGRGGVFAQYKGLLDTFGEQRVIDTPISEATIMGAAVGMALTGLRPVVELRVIDFALCAIDEIVNQAAKNRFMFGGQGRVPTVIRMPIGVWSGSAAQHSQSLESWFAHIPGLVVVAPSCAQDNYSLLRAALASDDPVIYLEHKEMWGDTGQVDTETIDHNSELGKARIVREGKDATVVTWSRAVTWTCEAAEKLAAQGIDLQVIDLRTLWPWDQALVEQACRQTGRLAVVHEAVQTAGYGAEIAATMAEKTGVPVTRIGAPRLPAGYSPGLEAVARIDGERIAQRITQWLGA